MEAACSLDDVARVLADDGYNITDDACFANGSYLPSMLSALDSPDIFPESPCSDEDIARVLDIAPMPSPSLLESCSGSSIAPHLSLPRPSSLHERFGAGIVKTRDPCITNAVLQHSLLNGLPNFPNRGSQSPDLLSMALNCSFPDDPSQFNSLASDKDNDILNHNFYFNSSSALSPLSETETILPCSSENVAKCSQQTFHHNFDVRFESNSLHLIDIESSPNTKTLDNTTNLESTLTEPEVIKCQEKRKRRRKSGHATSKSKRRKQENSKTSPKPQTNAKANITNTNPTQTQTIPHSNETKVTAPKTKSPRGQSKPSTKNKKTKTVPETSMGTFKDDAQTVSPETQVITEDLLQTQQPTEIGSTNGVVDETKGRRRSSRATKAPENYNFRLSSLVKRVQTERKQQEPKKPKGKAKPPPLSKYRRRTANARERDRMKEINDAFDDLKAKLPDMPPDDGKQKNTKFTILQLALNYIASLQDMLLDPVEDAGDTMDRLPNELSSTSSAGSCDENSSVGSGTNPQLAQNDQHTDASTRGITATGSLYSDGHES